VTKEQLEEIRVRHQVSTSHPDWTDDPWAFCPECTGDQNGIVNWPCDTALWIAEADREGRLDDLAEERRIEIDALRKVIERLESKIELAQEQADYGARHGQDAQDTLDVVLSALG
jgi:hypothetical protein